MFKATTAVLRSYVAQHFTNQQRIIDNQVVIVGELQQLNSQLTQLAVQKTVTWENLSRDVSFLARAEADLRKRSGHQLV